MKQGKVIRDRKLKTLMVAGVPRLQKINGVIFKRQKSSFDFDATITRNHVNHLIQMVAFFTTITIGKTYKMLTVNSAFCLFFHGYLSSLLQIYILLPIYSNTTEQFLH